MRVFNLSNGEATYVSENPHSDNLILKVTGLIVGGALGIVSVIVCGIWAVIAIAVLLFFRIVTEGC